MTTPVRKAVIPAAGLGTRFLPATKAVPKEMLPVIDRPAIQYAVEECAGAGITEVLVITSRGKESMADHFDRHPELEAELEKGGKEQALSMLRSLDELAQVHFVRQGEPRGLGHAVSVGRAFCGGEPFAVLLPDELMVDDSDLLRRLVAAAADHGGSAVALRDLPRAEVGAYGVVEVDETPAADRVVRVRGAVEKPDPAIAPSTLTLTGRYVFSPGLFDALDRTQPGTLGEIQLTDAIALLAGMEPVVGVLYDEGRYDVGKPLDMLRGVVELAVRRPDLAPPFREFLAELVRREGIV